MYEHCSCHWISHTNGMATLYDCTRLIGTIVDLNLFNLKVLQQVNPGQLFLPNDTLFTTLNRRKVLSSGELINRHWLQSCRSLYKMCRFKRLCWRQGRYIDVTILIRPMSIKELQRCEQYYYIWVHKLSVNFRCQSHTVFNVSPCINLSIARQSRDDIATSHFH